MDPKTVHGFVGNKLSFSEVAPKELDNLEQAHAKKFVPSR